MQKHERLRTARIEAGFASAADAARRLAVPYGTYSGHENGLRGMREIDLKTYARVFKVSLGWLAFGHDERVGTSEIEVFGEVLQDGIIETNVGKVSFPISRGAFSNIKLHFVVPPLVQAVQISGTHLKPTFDDQDVILFDRINDFNPGNHLDKLLIIACFDKKFILGKVYGEAANDLFTIVAPNGTALQGKVITWAAEIFAIVKGYRISNPSD